MCIGGPALIYYVTPTEEELFMVNLHSLLTRQQGCAAADPSQRYNPELQRRSLENRQQKQENFDAFVGRLKEYSKSDKPSMCMPSVGGILICGVSLTRRNSLDGMGAGRRAATGAGRSAGNRSAKSGGCRGRGAKAGNAEVFAVDCVQLVHGLYFYLRFSATIPRTLLWHSFSLWN